MKRILFIMIALLVTQLVFSSLLYDFAYDFFRQRKVPEVHAKLMASVFEEESKNIPVSVDPLYILAFGMSETGFVNTFGDSGKAVGYFQLHENAVIYVANFYQDVREFKKQHRVHSELIRYPDWQLKIAYRYFYLTLKHVHNWDIVRAISAYNGRKDRYNEYVIKFFQEYSRIVKAFIEFSKSYTAFK
ncbi:MAG: hypothetical protein ACK4R7_02195 [Fervidobacterium sp.]